MALLFKGKAIYFVLYVVAIVLFGGNKILGYSFDRLQAVRDDRRTYLFQGESCGVRLTFRNTSNLPLVWVSGHERLPTALEGGRAKRWVFSLRPRGETTVEYNLTGSRRGLFVTGPLELAAGDPLGLYEQAKTVPTHHEIVVYPNIHPLTELSLPSKLSLGNVKASQPVHPDPARLAGVRPYRSEDTRRWIHWKATARTGELQVRQFEHTVNVDTMILLNMNQDDYSVHSYSGDSELAVETAASLGNHVARTGESFGIVSTGILRREVVGTGMDAPGDHSKGDPVLRVTPRKGVGHLVQVLELLAMVELGPNASFPSIIAHEATALSWGATLMVVTPTDSVEVVETALMLTRAGYQVLIFVTGSKIIHHQLHNGPSQAGLRVFHVRRVRQQQGPQVQVQ